MAEENEIERMFTDAFTRLRRFPRKSMKLEIIKSIHETADFLRKETEDEAVNDEGA